VAVAAAVTTSEGLGACVLSFSVRSPMTEVGCRAVAQMAQDP
jgi:hypothetical protein